MRLLLVRHAPAWERDPGRWPDDRDRPLSAAGRRRGRAAALGLARIAPLPEGVLVSPLARARATAKILERVAGWPEAHVSPVLAPGAPPAALMNLLATRLESTLALVGHEPELGRLLGRCLGSEQAIALKKSGCALLEWKGRVRAGEASLAWLAPPRVLRAIG